MRTERRTTVFVTTAAEDDGETTESDTSNEVETASFSNPPDRP
ncbi:hypothetical protein [Salinibacter grassmerensis]|nr:hypothetical protein [Salinibacter grassmerensis]